MSFTRRRRQKKQRQKTLKRGGAYMKGGAYVSRGTYGCTFKHPSLKCKGNTMRAPRKISKLMVPKEADSEYALHDTLQKIDPQQHFLIYPERKCQPQFEPENRQELVKCPIFPYTSKGKNARKALQANQGLLLQYQDGGTDLQSLKLPVSMLETFFISFGELLKGVQRMHKQHRFFHLDIKAPNIVAGGDPFRVRLIDFGLALSGDSVIYNIQSSQPEAQKYIQYLEGLYTQPYFAYPFDIRFIFPTHKPYSQETVNKYISKRSTYLPSTVKWNLQAWNEYESWLTSSRTPLSQRVLFFLERVDVYSLGIVLATVVQKFLGFQVKDGQVFVRTAENKLSPVSVYEHHFRTMKFEYDSLIYIVKLFSNLASHMTHPNPSKRASIVKVVSTYQQILGKLKKLFRNGNLAHLESILQTVTKDIITPHQPQR